MSSKLPINLNALLRQRTVEGDRIEYKAGWNPDAIIKTLCAFANEFENLGGGYVVIGQDCDKDGRAIFPRSYLKEVGSELYDESAQMPFVDLCRQMNIVDPTGIAERWKDHGSSVPEPSDWRFFQRAGSHRGPLYGHPQDASRNGMQRLA